MSKTIDWNRIISYAEKTADIKKPKILEDKRRYLYAVYVDDTNVLIRWLLQFGWFRDKWEKHCEKKVQRMTEGEVLKAYYEKTRRESDEYPVSRVMESTH